MYRCSLFKTRWFINKRHKWVSLRIVQLSFNSTLFPIAERIVHWRTVRSFLSYERAPSPRRTRLKSHLLILISYPKASSLDCGLTKSHINWFQKFIIGQPSSFYRVKLWFLANWLICIYMHEVSVACLCSDAIVRPKRRSFAIFYARERWELLTAVALNNGL